MVDQHRVIMPGAEALSLVVHPRSPDDREAPGRSSVRLPPSLCSCSRSPSRRARSRGRRSLFDVSVRARAARRRRRRSTFAVTYINREGSAPAYVRVHIDDVADDMIGDGGTTGRKASATDMRRSCRSGFTRSSFEAEDTRKFRATAHGGIVAILGPVSTPGPTPTPTPTALRPPGRHRRRLLPPSRQRRQGRSLTPEPTLDPTPTPTPEPTPSTGGQPPSPTPTPEPDADTDAEPDAHTRADTDPDPDPDAHTRADADRRRRSDAHPRTVATEPRVDPRSDPCTDVSRGPDADHRADRADSHLARWEPPKPHARDRCTGSR